MPLNDSANGEELIRKKSEPLAEALRSLRFNLEDFGIANLSFQALRRPSAFNPCSSLVL